MADFMDMVTMVRYQDPFRPAEPWGWRSAFADSPEGQANMYGACLFSFEGDWDLLDSFPENEPGQFRALGHPARWMTV